MAPHSSTLAWKIPWTEEPGRLQSMGSLRVGQDSATSLSLSCIGEGNGNPLQCSCLENPRVGGASWAAVYGVAQSWTRLKRLSSSSSNRNNIWNILLDSDSLWWREWVTWVDADACKWSGKSLHIRGGIWSEVSMMRNTSHFLACPMVARLGIEESMQSTCLRIIDNQC